MPVSNSGLATALQGSSLIQIGLPISLFILMTGVGLTLRLKDFRSVVDYPRALILGTIAQIVVLPAAAFALAFILSLPPAIAVGLIIIAACPGGTTSNVFAFLGKGNLALSILMTASASLITVVTLPLFANWAILSFADQNLEQPLKLPIIDTIVMLLVIIFIPVMLGMALRSWKTQLAGKLEGAVSAFGMFVLLALVILIAYQTRDHLLELLIQAGPSVIALNLIGIAAGFGIAKLAGHDCRKPVENCFSFGSHADYYVENGLGSYISKEHFSTELPFRFYALIYIPEKLNENMLQLENEWGLKLYSRQVLIQNNNKKLLPEWLKFVKGVVDADNIPLNVSQEIV
mgnify:CR=1 FL=1